MSDDSIGNIIDMASKKPIEKAAWVKHLATTGGENPAYLPTVSNAMLILANAPEVAGMLAYNAFTNQPLLMRPAPVQEGGAALPGPHPRQWDGADVTLVHAYMQRLWSHKFGRETIENAMVADATLNQFHPIREWLDGLKWDGKERIDRWLIDAFKCADTPFHQAAGAKLLIAAVRRVRQPGCKFDQLLVLEGAQGIGKSSALKALFGPAYFSDSIPPDLNSKDAAMALLGVWGLEFAEIEHLIRTEVETIKAFLSRAVDRYRPPYGKAYVDRPRQGVLIGTTNADDYLRDATGNRRIWPVRCIEANPEWVAENRDQLWAEAAYREEGGEAIWLDDANIVTAAAGAAADRMSEDVWGSVISTWLASKTEATTADVLEFAVNMTKEKMNRVAQLRVASIMRSLGWTQHVAKEDGKSKRVWRHSEGGEALRMQATLPMEAIPF